MLVMKFFKILSIEFSDLEETMDSLLVSLNERYQKSEITEHVLKENRALFKRELTDMLIIHKQLMNLSSGDFSSVEEAKNAVLELIYSNENIPGAVHTYLEGRVTKVLRYLDEIC